MVWYYRRMYGRTTGRVDGGYNNIPAFSSKSAGIKMVKVNYPNSSSETTSLEGNVQQV